MFRDAEVHGGYTWPRSQIPGQGLGHGVDGCLGSRVLASCSHHAHRPIGKVDQWSFPRPSHELNYHVGFLETARSQAEGSGHKVHGSLGSLHLAEPWKRGLGHSPASSQDYTACLWYPSLGGGTHGLG